MKKIISSLIALGCLSAMVSVANAVSIGIGTPVISNGVITGITVFRGGSGFTSAPTVSITDDGGGSGATGSGATATASISGGIVTSVSVTSGGSGYTASTKVFFLPDPTDLGETPDNPDDPTPTEDPDGNDAPTETPDNPSTGTAKFINMSTRGLVQSNDGSDHLVLGFIFSGNEASSVFVRGTGPSLTSIPNRMNDPLLNFYQTTPSVTLLDSNDSWTSATGLNEVRSGHLTVFDASNTESLVVGHNLDPHVGYSANIGAEHGTGVALVEVFDLPFDLGQENDAGLINGGTRGFCGEGANERIIGFIIDGEPGTTLDVMVRTHGPSLGTPFFGNIQGAIPNPEVRLYNTGVNPPVELFHNDDWENVSGNVNAEQITNGFDLGLRDSLDSGFIFRNLSPGAYSVNASPKDGTSDGIVLVSVDIIE
jgi:hypothetical protein